MTADNNEVVVYICPNPSCNYLVSETLVTEALFDFSCPRCIKSTLSKFIRTILYSEQKKERNES